jgi:hypothetical protein
VLVRDFLLIAFGCVLCQLIVTVFKFCFLSRATTASSLVLESKMAMFTGAKQAHCVFWFQETKYTTQIRRHFYTQYAKIPPSKLSIYEWYRHFIGTGCFVTQRKAVDHM